MTKEQAKSLFGKTYTEMAVAIGRSSAAISMWADPLQQTQQDLVVGAAVRLGINVPKELLKP